VAAPVVVTTLTARFVAEALREYFSIAILLVRRFLTFEQEWWRPKTSGSRIEQ